MQQTRTIIILASTALLLVASQTGANDTVIGLLEQNLSADEFVRRTNEYAEANSKDFSPIDLRYLHNVYTELQDAFELPCNANKIRAFNATIQLYRQAIDTDLDSVLDYMFDEKPLEYTLKCLDEFDQLARNFYGLDNTQMSLITMADVYPQISGQDLEEPYQQTIAIFRHRKEMQEFMNTLVSFITSRSLVFEAFENKLSLSTNESLREAIHSRRFASFCSGIDQDPYIQNVYTLMKLILQESSDLRSLGITIRLEDQLSEPENTPNTIKLLAVAVFCKPLSM